MEPGPDIGKWSAQNLFVAETKEPHEPWRLFANIRQVSTRTVHVSGAGLATSHSPAGCAPAPHVSIVGPPSWPGM